MCDTCITQPVLPQPPVALIANGFATQPVIESVEAAVRAGIRWVHLRDHDATSEQVQQAAPAWAEHIWNEHPEVTLTVNTRLEMARALGSGLHTGWRGPRPETIAAPVPCPLGYSVHHLLELPAPRRRAVDYVTYSPVFPTSSKSGHPGTGIAALHQFCMQAGLPVLALGGITPERVAACYQAGVRGVAVLSGILHAQDPDSAAAAYLNAWRTASRT